jgi:ribosomal protein S18 acetylase RimI-like enzyme
MNEKTPGTNIRRAGPHDRAALEPLMAEFYAAEQMPWDATVVRPALDRLLASDEVGVVFVAEQGGALVGYAIITWAFDLEFAGRDAGLTDMFVAQAHRQRRVGQALLDAALAAARAGGAAALHLLVDPANLPAVALYRRGGFATSHRRPMTHDFRAHD